MANLRPLWALWEPTWDHLAPNWANLPVWDRRRTVFARVLGTMLGRFVACSWALRSVWRAPVATSSFGALAALAALAALFALLRVFLWCVLSRCLRCSGPRERRSKSSHHLKPPAQAAQRPSKGVGDRMGLLSRSSGRSSFFLTCLQLTPFTRFPFHDSQVFFGQTPRAKSRILVKISVPRGSQKRLFLRRRSGRPCWSHVGSILKPT